MDKYFKVVDGQDPVKQNYFPIVFFRGERVYDKISSIRWFWLCIIELIFGEELLECLVTTASNSGCPEDKDFERKFGDPKHLNLHIPSGLFTNMFRNQIIQVLYYKFYLQYLFLGPVSEPYINEKECTIDVSLVRFRLNKSLLYLVIPFRRVYILSAILFNGIIDLTTYFITSNITYAILVGVCTEIIRRTMKL